MKRIKRKEDQHGEVDEPSLRWAEANLADCVTSRKKKAEK
jgi:hypothetical protein